MIMGAQKTKLRELIITYQNKFICVKYKRKQDLQHTFVGEVIKVRKASFILRLNDTMKISIGFRNIVGEPKAVKNNNSYYKVDGTFWCKKHEYSGVGSNVYCGKSNCEAYKPKNGENGCCRYYSKNIKK